MEYTAISNRVEETIKIGDLLGRTLNSKIIIGIDGDMGCGKTHLIKGIAKGLNIENNITSPTFNLVNEYKGEKLDLYHFDVYRINSLDDLFLIGFDEYLKDNAITIIEWSSLVSEILPIDTNYIRLRKLNDNQRKIKFNFSEKYENILEKFIHMAKEIQK